MKRYIGSGVIKITRFAVSFLAIWLVISAALLAGLSWYNRQQNIVLEGTKIEATVRHPVTEEMWKSANSFSNIQAPNFRLPDLEGKVWSLNQIAKGRPVVLYFIKYGCPCSIDVEPLFIKMQKQLGSRVVFVGIINSNKTEATAWRDDTNSNLILLMDESTKTMQYFKAKQSVYTALVRPNGTIEKLWPGYSASMLKELNETASNLAGFKSMPFDPDYAPIKMTSGCSFYD